MHEAPTVDYPVGHSRFQTHLLLVLWLGVVAVNAVWFGWADRLDWRHGLGVAVTFAAALIALRIWRRSPEGILHWDGQSWWWESNGIRSSGAVLPHLDLQSILLVGFGAHSGARYWFWLEQSGAPSRWGALRRAVHAPQRSDADAKLGDYAPAVEPGRRCGTNRP